MREREREKEKERESKREEGRNSEGPNERLSGDCRGGQWQCSD